MIHKLLDHTMHRFAASASGNSSVVKDLSLFRTGNRQARSAAGKRGDAGACRQGNREPRCRYVCNACSDPHRSLPRMQKRSRSKKQQKGGEQARTDGAWGQRQKGSGGVVWVGKTWKVCGCTVSLVVLSRSALLSHAHVHVRKLRWMQGDKEVAEGVS